MTKSLKMYIFKNTIMESLNLKRSNRFPRDKNIIAQSQGPAFVSSVPILPGENCPVELFSFLLENTG